MSKWQYHDSDCSNTPNYCFLGDKGLHFAISPADIGIWSSNIALGLAGLDNPLIKMYKSREDNHGAITRSMLKLIKKEKLFVSERMASATERLVEMHGMQAYHKINTLMIETMDQSIRQLPQVQQGLGTAARYLAILIVLSRLVQQQSFRPIVKRSVCSFLSASRSLSPITQ